MHTQCLLLSLFHIGYYLHLCSGAAACQTSFSLLQIDFMKRQGLLDKTYNRRRDEQSMYMEESCKFKHLMKRAGATAAAAVKA